ncbi:Rb-like protein [Cavenderia fasciculata]|uniref:Rb-like protein n=1 Tax=Cavenderia fasciculata TaxID=261658 RepID=F4QEM9_CACFS|nr:Rb-like protein [Cavenderia fasciculata]EGG14140.1 Rb-like protein [Cavenderia fasciculata]|eukprot:XP_004350848.1 Rb-like protein [Cavenderia fasciculata]
MDDTILSRSTSQGSIDELVAAVDSLRETQQLSLEILKEKFQDFISTLNIDQDTSATAWALIEDLKLSSDINASDQKHYIACSLFVAGNIKFNVLLKNYYRNPKDSSTPKQSFNSVYLSQLLKLTNIKLKEFFEVPLPRFIAWMGLGKAVEEQFKNLEQSFVIMNILYRKYEELYSLLFHFDSKEPKELLAIGWFIYLYCKSRLFVNQVPDLMKSINLLLCSLDFIYIHSPDSFKRSTTMLPIENDSILPFLTKKVGSNIKDLDEKTFSIYIEMMKKSNILKYTNNMNNMNNNNHNESFFNSTLLMTNYNNLNKNYEQQYYSSGDIDERMFLFDKEIIGTPFKANHHFTSISTPTSKFRDYNNNNINNTNNTNNNNQYGGGHLTPVKQQMKLNPPQTPISSSLSMIEWIKKSIQNYQAEPSQDLKDLVKDCGEENVQFIQTMACDALNLAQPFLSQQVGSSGGIEKENKRSIYGIKLYYYLLEKILNIEKARIGSNSPTFKNFIMHGEFHKSLLITCFEIVAHAYKLVSVEFPFFVKLFNVHPFSYCRIIDNIIKIDGAFPTNLINHFSKIDDQIIEKYAWSTGSPIFPLFEKSRDQLPPINNHQTNNNINNNNHLTQVFSTPVKNNNNNNNNNNNKPLMTNQVLSSPSKNNQPNNNNNNPSKLFITIYKKIQQYLSTKCKKFCSILNLPKEMIQHIITASMAIVTELTSLLNNRTLEIIVICSIYALCKLNQHTISFKNIIENTGTPQVYYKEVILTNNTPGDIVAFYNKIFLPLADPIIQRFKNTPSRLMANLHQHQQQQQHQQQYHSTPTKIIMSPSKPLIPTHFTISPMSLNRQSSNSSLLSQQQQQQPQQLQSNLSQQHGVFQPLQPSPSPSQQQQPLQPPFNDQGTPTKLAGSFSIGKTPSKELKSINMNIAPKSTIKLPPQSPSSSSLQTSSSNSNSSTSSSSLSSSTSSSTTPSSPLGNDQFDPNNNNNSNSNSSSSTSSLSTTTTGKTKGKRLFFDNNNQNQNNGNGNGSSNTSYIDILNGDNNNNNNSISSSSFQPNELEPPLKK